ncbi:protein disulfide-isomerase precursor [Tulasnella sp. 419]|nr:protein disulfide-isomerase precursor [Tulasnella sp. 419]
MRFSSLFGSAVVLGASFVAASDVIDLTADNFDSVVNAEDLLLVEFFAPWCGHCKALAPEYESAATSLKEKGLKLAKVDCVDQSDLCNNHGVTGYPTLKVFRKGKPTDYGGPRKSDGIVSYMIKQSLPAVSEVTAANHDEFKSSDRVVVIAYLPSSTEAPAPIFSQVADAHRDDYLFGLVSDEAAIKAAGVTPPAIVLYKQFDEGRNDFPSKGIADTSRVNLEKFVTENALPLMDEISGENYPTYSQSGIPLAYLFVDPSTDGKDATIDAIKPVAKKFRGKVNFVWIDALKYGEHAKTLNLKPDSLPAFVVQDMESGFKYPLDQSNPPSFALVDDLVEKLVAGKLEPSLKSEPVPEAQNEPVTVIVGTEYDKYVNDLDKDVLVEFYAPWCGHCKRLKPTWDELGERYSQIKDKLTIAKMDATENDLPPSAPFKISGFPTIKFRAAGSTEFIDYEGDRSMESFVEFLKKHAKNDITVPEPEVKEEPVASSASSSAAPAETPADHVKDEL